MVHAVNRQANPAPDALASYPCRRHHNPTDNPALNSVCPRCANYATLANGMRDAVITFNNVDLDSANRANNQPNRFIDRAIARMAHEFKLNDPEHKDIAILYEIGTTDTDDTTGHRMVDITVHSVAKSAFQQQLLEDVSVAANQMLGASANNRYKKNLNLVTTDIGIDNDTLGTLNIGTRIGLLDTARRRAAEVKTYCGIRSVAGRDRFYRTIPNNIAQGFKSGARTSRDYSSPVPNTDESRLEDNVILSMKARLEQALGASMPVVRAPQNPQLHRLQTEIGELKERFRTALADQLLAARTDLTAEDLALPSRHLNASEKDLYARLLSSVMSTFSAAGGQGRRAGLESRGFNSLNGANIASILLSENGEILSWGINTNKMQERGVNDAHAEMNTVQFAKQIDADIVNQRTVMLSSLECCSMCYGNLKTNFPYMQVYHTTADPNFSVAVPRTDASGARLGWRIHPLARQLIYDQSTQGVGNSDIDTRNFSHQGFSRPRYAGVAQQELFRNRDTGTSTRGYARGALGRCNDESSVTDQGFEDMDNSIRPGQVVNDLNRSAVTPGNTNPVHIAAACRIDGRLNDILREEFQMLLNNRIEQQGRASAPLTI